MAQKRSLDYRTARSTKALNDKLSDLRSRGILEGIEVQADGTITAGKWVSSDGVVIEETTDVSVAPSAGDATLDRVDTVYAYYQYLQTEPAPLATYHIVEGTPGDSDAPDVPLIHQSNSIVLASCIMPALGTVWTTVIQQPSELFLNCYAISLGRYIVEDGSKPALIFGEQKSTTSSFLFPEMYYKYIASGTHVSGVPFVISSYEDYSLAIVDNKIYQVSNLSGSTWSWSTDNTVKENSDAVKAMTGVGWTTETVKANADAIVAHITNTTGAHNASAIALTDAGNRITATEVEGALQEIVGAGRTSETIKQNADDIETEALARSNADISLQTLINGKVNKTGDTVSGVLTHQREIILPSAYAHQCVFDDYIEFKKIISPWQMVPITQFTTDPSTPGNWAASVPDDDYIYARPAGADLLFVPIESIPDCYIDSIKVYGNITTGLNKQFLFVDVRKLKLFSAGSASLVGANAEEFDPTVSTFGSTNILGMLSACDGYSYHAIIEVQTVAGQEFWIRGAEVGYKRKKIAV